MEDENGTESQGHPAWQSILDKLPPELQAIVKPELETWDKSVQQKVQGLQEKFSPYKEFVENEVDPQTLKQSLFIANHLQTNPEDFVRRAVENYGLNDIFSAGNSINETTPDPEEELVPEWEQNGETEMNNPQIAQLLEMVTTLNEKVSQDEKAKQEAAQVEEFNTYLNKLEEEHGAYDRDYVTALISAGVDGAEAVQKYNEIVNKHVANVVENNNPGQQQSDPQAQPFMAMGAAGTAGSGNADNPVDLGSLTNGQTADLVAEMIAKSQQA